MGAPAAIGDEVRLVRSMAEPERDREKNPADFVDDGCCEPDGAGWGAPAAGGRDEMWERSTAELERDRAVNRFCFSAPDTPPAMTTGLSRAGSKDTSERVKVAVSVGALVAQWVRIVVACVAVLSSADWKRAMAD